jgi:hypothetical protein
MAIKRTIKYLPPDLSAMSADPYSPDLTRRHSCSDLLTDYGSVFEQFLVDTQLSGASELCGLRIKSKHTIVEPWPYRAGLRTTRKEFDVLRTESTSGIERYVEFEKLE